MCRAALLTAVREFRVASGDAAWSQSDVCGESAQIIAARGILYRNYCSDPAKYSAAMSFSLRALSNTATSSMRPV